ncbi:cation transporter, partial [Escherichia coli]
MYQTIVLDLDGLSCERCAKRVKDSLENLPNIDHAEVTIETAYVTGSASVDEIIGTIRKNGYEAKLSDHVSMPPHE